MNRSFRSKRRDVAPRSDGWLTRAQVARLLGISKSRVQQLEARGDVRSTKDEHGRCRYDPVEVLELVERRREDEGIPPSADLDRLFEMFDADRSVLEIRLATGLSTETLTRLFAEYRTPIRQHYARTVEEREEEMLLAHEHRLRDVGRRTRSFDDDD